MSTADIINAAHDRLKEKGIKFGIYPDSHGATCAIGHLAFASGNAPGGVPTYPNDNDERVDDEVRKAHMAATLVLWEAIPEAERFEGESNDGNKVDYVFMYSDRNYSFPDKIDQWFKKAAGIALEYDRATR